MLMEYFFIPAIKGKTKENRRYYTMSEAKTFSTTVKRYAVIVSVPFRKNYIVEKRLNIEAAARSFLKRRDYMQDHDVKVIFDTARVLLEYAYSFGAQLEDMKKVEDELFITLSFISCRDMLSFSDTVTSVVESSAMH